MVRYSCSPVYVYVDVCKTLVISRAGRMCIGGSGLCMEGEQRKKSVASQESQEPMSDTGVTITKQRGGESRPRGQEV